jgi:hypothetical protein
MYICLHIKSFNFINSIKIKLKTYFILLSFQEKKKKGENNTILIYLLIISI